MSMYIEILAPARNLSKSFQHEDIYIVGSVFLINQVKSQLERIEKKSFEYLPTVKRFLEKVSESDDGTYSFQDVTQQGYARDLQEVTNSKKTNIVNSVKNAIGNRW